MMKRLIKGKKNKRLRTANKINHNVVLADWVSVDTNNQDVVEIITDAMSNDDWIQIEYEGSGWRLIQPYGWNTSRAGNALLMCYKDSGEIRSYRFDKILQILVDDSLLEDKLSDPGEIYETDDYDTTIKDDIPLLPTNDEYDNDQELPYTEGIEYLAGS